MEEQIAFRISGSLIEEAALLRHFRNSRFVSRGVYKVFAQRTTDRLAPLRVSAGEDIVAVKLWGGPMLVLHPAHARELLQSVSVPVRGDPGDTAVTDALPWSAPRARGCQGSGQHEREATIDWFAVLRAAGPPDAPAPDLLALARDLDRRSAGGLRRVPPPDAPPAQRVVADPCGPQPTAGPALVFLPGTLLDSRRTFRKMWESASAMGKLCAQYDAGNVLAYDHATLTVDPVANAIGLVDALPDHTVLDLVTHARGGLVAEVLVRAAHQYDAAAARCFAGPDAAPLLAQVQALRNLMREKSISVRRVVRVACPARGTLLASGRVDAWLSVLHWLARINGIEGIPAWFAFLCECARQRAVPESLPGLAAMLPDGPLVRWLNAPLANERSELYVVAGHSQGDSMVTWLRTLVSDALLWTDNDLLVQTRSMYGGVPREASGDGRRFQLLHDDTINHFAYFARPDTVAGIAAALLGQPGSGWSSVGPVSRAAEAREPREAARVDPGKPGVLLIPNLFGSVLTARDSGEVLWLDDRSLTAFERLALTAEDVHADPPPIRPTQLLGAYFDGLREYLGQTHNVFEFAYDWRRCLAHQARALDTMINERLSCVEIGEHPLRIVAHGAGGLLLRAWHAAYPASWAKLMTRAGARVMFLGVPNGGSWLPLRMLCGDYTFGTLFGMAGTIEDEAGTRELLAAMPGLIAMQAGLTDPRHGLDNAATWRALAQSEYAEVRRMDRWHGAGPPGNRRQLDRWAIPAQDLLNGARAFWQELQRALPDLLRDIDKLVLVAGTPAATVTGFEKTESELFLVSTPDGDRHVSLDSAGLPGAALWTLGLAHDALVRTPAAYPALAELLAAGASERAGRVERGGQSGSEAPTPANLRKRPPWHGGRMLTGADLPELITAAGTADEGPDDASLTVRVHHGDLRFIRDPLIIGHYKSMMLTGAEAVIDSLVGRRMAKALRAGMYPERLGSYQIFENGHHSNAGRRKQRYIPRPRAAVVVGLGAEGDMNAQKLSYTIRIGVLAYAERLTEQRELQAPFGLAATLIGSGGSGVSVSTAALALVQGIIDANGRLREAGWPTVGTLTIVEVYLDRAIDAWRAIRMQAESVPKLKLDGYLVPGNGSLRRPIDTSYRGAAYDFISAVKAPDSEDMHPKIAYSLDTRRARTEVRAQQAQGALVRDLVRKASNTVKPDRLIGRTLFNLLIPVEIEPYLTGSTDMLMELDSTTSSLPWELLDTDPPLPAADQGAVRPWAIRCKVLRKLRTENYRGPVVDAAPEDNMLVIGEPLTTDARYIALPGAKAEAHAVADVARYAFGTRAERVTELNDRPNATRVINALFARNYRIVHIAGHGTGMNGSGQGGGVVLSGESTFLGAQEIQAMRITPELVFVNCCHTGEGDRRHYDRVEFASSVATALIRIGVRCVIAAGWAIDDEAAKVFATTFYAQLFSGKRFIDAVGAARTASWEQSRGSNTWAAYQCYGDPDWSWRAAGGTATPAPEEEYAGVASPLTLILVLHAITTEQLYTTADQRAHNRARLEYLQEKFAHWTDRGDVAQEFGAAFAALPDRAAAIHWYRRAIAAPDSTSAVSTLEQYAEQLSLPGATAQELQDAIRKFRLMGAVYGKSSRRHRMHANALRRLSVALDAAAATTGSRKTADEARFKLRMAIEEYRRAAACEPASTKCFYPLWAALACRVRQAILSRPAVVTGSAGAQAIVHVADVFERELAEVLRHIRRAVEVDSQFWTIAVQSEFDIVKGILRENLTSRKDDIHASLRDLHNRINTERFWMVVYDETRFVMEPYRRLMQEDRLNQPMEERSAGTLLDQLRSYAEGTAHHGAQAPSHN